MEWQQILGVRPEVSRLIAEAETKMRRQHDMINAIALFNQAKVLEAFRRERITEDYFQSNEGYGYHDPGREKLDALFARVFRGEDALVRPHLVSGTHTLFTCLRGLLRPGDRLLAVTGQPYDTLLRAMGGRGGVGEGKSGNEGNLQDWGIDFEYIEKGEGKSLQEMLQKPTKVVLIQRSRGYDPHRPSLTIDGIANLIARIRSINSQVIILVDNCYGEFVEKEEPLEAGADILAGSLIKNPGGGLAPTGGYIVGKAEYINMISNAMTAPGLGKALGAFVYNKKLFFQGLFMAPHLVGESLRGAVILAETLEQAGYSVSPRPVEKRGDIVQLIRLKKKEELQLLCRAVQESSPINAHFTPVEGETPGYRDPIFMAGGTFVQGSSSELSADAPLREPYCLYLQGGLSYQHYILGVASILEAVSPPNHRC